MAKCDFRKFGNLKVWLTMKNLSRTTIASSAITTWGDISGNNIDFTQATTANKPTIVTDTLGGQKVARFNGTTQVLASSTSLGGTLEAYCVARAVRAPGVLADDRIEYLLCSENSQAYDGTSLPTGIALFIYNVYGAYGNAAWNNVANCDSNGGGTNVTYQNGLVSSNRIVAQNQWNIFGFTGTAITSNPFQLGHSVDTTAYYGQVDIAEVLIFNPGQPHSQSMRDYINRALERKWGILQYG